MDLAVPVASWLEAGAKLLGELGTAGLAPGSAFWLRPDGHRSWALYLECPVSGTEKSYREAVLTLIRHHPEIGIDWLAVRFVNFADSLARAAQDELKLRRSYGQLSGAPADERPASIMLDLDRFGGYQVDGPVYLYLLDPN